MLTLGYSLPVSVRIISMDESMHTLAHMEQPVHRSISSLCLPMNLSDGCSLTFGYSTVTGFLAICCIVTMKGMMNASMGLTFWISSTSFTPIWGCSTGCG